MRPARIRMRNALWLSVILVPGSALRGDEPRSADLIIRHAKVITVDREFRIAEAVAIRGDRVLAAGSEAEIARLAGPATRIMDAGGKTLLPGLYDSHVHPLGAAHSEKDHPIPSFDTLNDVLKYFADRAKVQPKGTWIVARYAFPTRLKESRFPTRDELDRVAPDHMVLHQGGPAGIVNTKALRHSGITRDTPDPPAGRIVKDPRTGEPTGMMRNAYSALKDLPDDAYGDDAAPGRRSGQGTVRDLQRPRADEHRRPRGERRGDQALSRAAGPGRAERTDQRDPDHESPLLRPRDDRGQAQ